MLTSYQISDGHRARIEGYIDGRGRTYVACCQHPDCSWQSEPYAHTEEGWAAAKIAAMRHERH